MAWRGPGLGNGTRQETVKVRGPLSTNDGESALAWALVDFLLDAFEERGGAGDELLEPW